jgi:hypothetical protein
MKAKPAKAKTPIEEEFESARSLWRMTFGCETFQAVEAGIQNLLEREINGKAPGYYPLAVGLICLYGRPFTNNFPVGPLSEDIIPKEFLELHKSIMILRHKTGAHTDASPIIPDTNLYELIFENRLIDGCLHSFRIGVDPLFVPDPDFFQEMQPLLKVLIEKTRYSANRVGNRFRRYFTPHKNIGEFRLNVLDPTEPMFSRLSQAQKQS